MVQTNNYYRWRAANATATASSANTSHRRAHRIQLATQSTGCNYFCNCTLCPVCRFEVRGLFKRAFHTHYGAPPFPHHRIGKHTYPQPMRIGEPTMRAMNSKRIASHRRLCRRRAAPAAYSRAHIDCMTNCHLKARLRVMLIVCAGPCPCVRMSGHF